MTDESPEEMPALLRDPAGVFGSLLDLAKQAATEEHVYKLVPWHEVNLLAVDGYLFCSGGVVPQYVDAAGNDIGPMFLMYRVRTVADHASELAAQAANQPVPYLPTGRADRLAAYQPASDAAAGADPLAIPPNRIPEPRLEPPVPDSPAAGWPGTAYGGYDAARAAAETAGPVPGSPGSGTVLEPDQAAAELGLEEADQDSGGRAETHGDTIPAAGPPADPAPAPLSPFDPDAHRA